MNSITSQSVRTRPAQSRTLNCISVQHSLQCVHGTLSSLIFIIVIIWQPFVIENVVSCEWTNVRSFVHSFAQFLAAAFIPLLLHISYWTFSLECTLCCAHEDLSFFFLHTLNYFPSFARLCLSRRYHTVVEMQRTCTKLLLTDTPHR